MLKGEKRSTGWWVNNARESLKEGDDALTKQGKSALEQENNAL